MHHINVYPVLQDLIFHILTILKLGRELHLIFESRIKNFIVLLTRKKILYVHKNWSWDSKHEEDSKNWFKEVLYFNIDYSYFDISIFFSHENLLLSQVRFLQSTRSSSLKTYY